MLAGVKVRQGSNSPLDQYVFEGRMDQPPKRAFVRRTSGQAGKREGSSAAEGNWRWQMECQCVRELCLETSWWGPRFADWKKPGMGWLVLLCGWLGDGIGAEPVGRGM